MITDDQHRQMGAILGFPECCVEEWICTPIGAGTRRGVQRGTTRTPAEQAQANQQITVLLGRPWAFAGPIKEWVPCSKCM